MTPKTQSKKNTHRHTKPQRKSSQNYKERNKEKQRKKALYDFS
jgi:hypothetical protein